MDRDSYREWNNHPLRSILRACATDSRHLPSKQELKQQLEEAGVPPERHGGILLVAQRIAETANAPGVRSKTDATRLADEKSIELVRAISGDTSLLESSDNPPSQTATTANADALGEAIWKELRPFS